MLSARFSTATHRGWPVSIFLLVTLLVTGFGTTNPVAGISLFGLQADQSRLTTDLIFYDGFESGSLGGNWSIFTTNQGRVQVSSAYPYAGTYSLLLDDSLDDYIYSIAAAILAVDLSGRTQVELDFYWYEWPAVDDSSDGIFISDDDGYSWSRILNFEADPTDWRHLVVDLDEAAASASRDLTANFLIKFQYYDDDPIPTNGFGFDEVKVQVPHVPVPASLPYYTGFESGELGEEWAISFTNDGRIRVDTYNPYAGDYSLLLDDWLDDYIYSIATAILAVDLSGKTQVLLDFYWYEWPAADDSSDGVFISDDDGYSWSRILSFDADPTDWKHEIIDLDEAAASASRDFTANFLIKFQFYDDDPIPTNGFAFDEVQVRQNAPPTLEWTGQTNYEQDGLNPEEGMDSDLYNYRILYKDADNDPPGNVRVHILKSGLEITGSPYYLSCSSGDYITGEICSYYIKGLEAGDDYTYYFTAQDDQGNLAVPTIILDAPDVTLTLRVYLPLTPKIYGMVTEAPYLNPIDNADGDYKYTVSWSEVEKADTYTLQQDDNSYFSSPATIYVGSGTSKSVSVSDVGRYYYRVKASNDISESDWSNTQSTLVTVGPPPCPDLGWWSGPISVNNGWIRFYVDDDPYCQVEEMEVTLDICGGTMEQTIEFDTVIVDDKFSIIGLGEDEYIRGTFLSSSYAEGSLLLYVDCYYPLPITFEVMGTWEADPSSK